MSAINDKITALLKKGDYQAEKTIIEYNRELAKQYQLALKSIRNEIDKLYQKLGDNISLAQAQNLNRLNNLESKINKILKQLSNNTIDLTGEAIKELYRYSHDFTSFAVQKSLNIDLGFGLVNENSVLSALINPYDKIGWENRSKINISDLNNSVRNEITQGLIQGKSYSVVSKVITEKLNIGVSKSVKIVRTEAHRSQNLGRLHAFEKSEQSAKRLGLKVNRVWISGKKNPRDSHIALDNTIADNNGYWHFSDGGSTTAPGLSGLANQDINCQCTTRLEIVGYSSPSKEQVIPDTFEDYINENS